MPGILYVVATPIGNLEDVTLRALRILREVSLIAAEDTRRTAKLLQHYSISTPTTSLHQHNEHQRSPAIIARLQAGQSVALVADAGTPIVSDPGANLVAAAHAAQVKVEPVPGASAVTAALSASGFPADTFVFAGFPPARSKARNNFLSALRLEQKTLVFYEAPHRVQQTLADMLAIFGDRLAAIARELTKSYEELVVRPISAHIVDLKEPRGEYTIVVSPSHDSTPSVNAPSSQELALEFGLLTNDGVPPRAAIKELARRYELPARTVYAAVHHLDESVD